MLSFEEKLILAKELNKRLAAGKLVGQLTTESLIKNDELSVEQMKDLVSLSPKFEVGVAYVVGQLLSHNDELYEVIQAHTSQADWTPDTVPALFKAKTVVAVIPEFVQPTGAHDAYNIGDKVIFEGQTYESLIDTNTWSPTAYPQGWKLI